MRLLIAFLVVAALVTSCKPSHAEDRVPKGESVVVVELFTSQGCSSCPPADKILTEIGSDPKLAGKVIALAYHVDYWDYIGWKDPFASELWSNRQRDYGNRAFQTRRIYTPQLVVNGSEHLVGSNRTAVNSSIAKASSTPALAKLAVTRTAGDGSIQISGTATLERMSAEPLQVVLVVYENKLTTRVTRGENTGRTLQNDHIVRKLVGAGKLSGASGTTVKVDTRVTLDPSWDAKNVGVVVLVQHPKTMAIVGAVGL